jgi:predicted nuclease of restriction endonuclease-like (RecB) superfamily
MVDKDYIGALELIKQEIQTARFHVVKTITQEHIRLYWKIGRIILEKQKEQGWGKSVVEKISNDLQKDYPESSGFSARNLWDMRRFYSRYSRNEKLRQLVAEIPWGQNLLILTKINDDKEAEYYLNATKEYGWSRNVLLNQIKAQAYQRALSENKTHNFQSALPEYLTEQADEALKSEYNLEFLGLKEGVKEKELENKMIERIRDVIMEFGAGFAFLGNQFKIKLADKEYFIDLLFYHRKLQCLVAVELKVGEFKPEYAGKLNFYLEVLDNTEKSENENPSIGILLCAEKDSLEVEFALRTTKKPIGVSEYKLTKDLPEKYKNYLPDNKMIIQKLRE